MADFAKFETVSLPVSARRLFVDTVLVISGKQQLCPAGMWLVKVKGGTGALLLMPDDLFRIQCRPTDTQSEAAWKEQTNTVYPQWPDGKPISLN